MKRIPKSTPIIYQSRCAYAKKQVFADVLFRGEHFRGDEIDTKSNDEWLAFMKAKGFVNIDKYQIN